MHQIHNPKKSCKNWHFCNHSFHESCNVHVYEIFLPIHKQKVCGAKKVAVPTEWSLLKKLYTTECVITSLKSNITVLVLRKQHQNFGGKLTKVGAEVC